MKVPVLVERRVGVDEVDASRIDALQELEVVAVEQRAVQDIDFVFRARVGLESWCVCVCVCVCVAMWLEPPYQSENLIIAGCLVCCSPIRSSYRRTLPIRDVNAEAICSTVSSGRRL